MAGLDRKVKARRRQNKQAEKRAAKAAKKQEHKAEREAVEPLGVPYREPAER
jgi:hypothetical protein